MLSVKTRVAVPKQAGRGEIIQIKTLAGHPMDNGYMIDREGRRIPRQLIHRFEALYKGELVFRADLHEAISTNPLISFFVVATDSGRMEFKWYDDDGSVYTDSAEITVT
jgi:sulfur-oxidizing protein SoxZ